MLKKGTRFEMSIMYWVILIGIFLFISYKNLFFDWSIQNYLSNKLEFETFGRYVFILFTSFIEAFIYILFIRFIVFLFNKAILKQR
ncbi:hypothetical protein [Lysinibacillus fusiformis]|uniref:hypothetical protein n=1 Tax=Lysinibacillus fusiformis TaxID=28031 RepID=UPI0030186900